MRSAARTREAPSGMRTPVVTTTRTWGLMERSVGEMTPREVSAAPGQPEQVPARWSFTSSFSWCTRYSSPPSASMSGAMISSRACTSVSLVAMKKTCYTTGLAPLRSARISLDDPGVNL